MISTGRREFLAALATLSAWPITTRAQQVGSRRVGALMSFADDGEGRALVATFEKALAELGRPVGAKLRIDYRWGAGDIERTRAQAAELVKLMPDAILVQGAAASRCWERRWSPLGSVICAGAQDRALQGLCA